MPYALRAVAFGVPGPDLIESINRQRKQNPQLSIESVIELSNAVKRRNGYTDQGTSVVSTLVGFVGWQRIHSTISRHPGSSKVSQSFGHPKQCCRHIKPAVDQNSNLHDTGGSLSLSLRPRLQQQPSSALVSELLSPLPLQGTTIQAHLYVRLTHYKRSHSRSCIFAEVIINKLSGCYYCIISCKRNLQASTTLVSCWSSVQIIPQVFIMPGRNQVFLLLWSNINTCPALSFTQCLFRRNITESMFSRD